MSATITSDRANIRKRDTVMVPIFANSGWGSFVGPSCPGGFLTGMFRMLSKAACIVNFVLNQLFFNFRSNTTTCVSHKCIYGSLHIPINE